MSFEETGATALDDGPCCYDGSLLPVRGPRRSLGTPYLAFLGGSETYGKFVERPFSALVETALGRPCINLGCMNAGVDALAQDAGIMRIAAAAERVVVQVPGAQNLNNRFYRVHPRRNDRFLEATPMLKAIYGEIDFTDFHFNKHMLFTLHTLCESRFETIREELNRVWVARMSLMLRHLGGSAVLLWLRNRTEDGPLGGDPLLVTRAMLDQLLPDVTGILEIPYAAARDSGELSQMLFAPLQAPAAERAMGPGSHAQIARKVAAALGKGA